MPKVLLGLPTYDDRSSTRQLLKVMGAAQDRITLDIKTIQLSALCWCFNQFWAMALNDKTYDFFLLMHADIIPQSPPRWIGRMVNEAEAHHADIVSVLSPIKSPHGMTSTGLETKDRHARRLTIREARKLPDVFGAQDLAQCFGWDDASPVLLGNTGLMLCDLRRNRDKWEQMRFYTNDQLARVNGKFVAFFDPEDWNFHRDAHRLGLRAVVTQSVELLHHGAVDYSNAGEWGTSDKDTEWQTISSTAQSTT